VLLWSKNSTASSNVEKEWRWALECGTPIIPVLLDETSLPPELSSLHAVSLREFVVKRKRRLSLGQFPPSEWMGLGSVFDLVSIVGTLIAAIVVGLLAVVGMAHEWLIINILSWIVVPFVVWFLIMAFFQIPLEVSRAKLRRKLSRIVVQSLKEWGAENRMVKE